MNLITAGSKSQLLVPITKPSSGVNHIEVSTTLPFATAQTEAPLPT